MNYTDIFMDYEIAGFNAFVDSVKKKHHLTEKTEDIVELMLECLKEEAIKKKNRNYAVLGFSDEQLEQSIIKAATFVPRWKKSKTESKEKKETKVTNTTVGDTYFDKNGQKHTKSKKKETKEKKGDTFDLTQLELFDFE